ncbi:MAG: hypothetical protein DDT24_00089 [Chloroflexi bacterium]|nr:hypothetical protein [Chloroflexota bacterium]
MTHEDDAVAKRDATGTLLKDNPSNYRTIFIANTLLSFADGLYFPFLVAFFYRLGGIPLTGSGLGLILIFESIGGYFAGRGADKYGRKSLFLISSIVSIVVYISYPLLPLLEPPNLRFLVLLLILLVDGMANGCWHTVEAVYLADITSETSRGKKVGVYLGAGGAISGVAMLGAGFLGMYINFLTVALMVVFIYSSGFLILLRIKEVADKK